MKQKTLLLSASIFVSLTMFAQTKEERAVIKEKINTAEITRLQEEFTLEYQERQAKIEAFLRNNSEAKRTYKKDGNVYQIHHISSEGKPVYIGTKDQNQIDNTKSSALYSGGSLGVNITGTGMIAGVWDGGQVNDKHELLTGKVTMQANQGENTEGGNDHMQAVSGIMVGKKLTSSSNTDNLGLTATGIAYDATTHNFDWNNDIAEMTTFAGEGFLISNHSYGYGNGPGTQLWLFGAYDNTAKNWDELLKNTPNYLPFVAAGNEQKSSGNSQAGGFDIITGSSASKNVVTVGAINLDNTMSDYSNWGPTDDGRVKPDIVTLGTAINVPKYAGNSDYTGVNESSSGTSYASPAAAAAGLLLQQYYKSLFGNYMTAASLKALMLHTADDTGNQGPDAKFGWGILNVERAAQTIKQMQTEQAKLVEFTVNPTNDSSSEVNQSGLLANGTSVKASICWTDDEGPEQVEGELNSTKSRLIYNFDLLLRNINGNSFKDAFSYQPLNITTPNDNASAGTSWFQNNVDNYKQANLSSADIDSKIIVYVRKSSSSPASTRNFSLLITGLKAKNMSISDADDTKSIVFYNVDDSKLKMISKDFSTSFGEYKIFDISGKLVQSGNEKSNEIFFQKRLKGVYVLVYKNNGNVQSLKF